MSVDSSSSSTDSSSVLAKGRPCHGILDFLVLFILLAGVNFLVARDDVGWFEVNPTPYLIIPVLIGVRYGFTAGVCAGLLTTLLLLVGRHMISHGVSFMEHRFTLLTLSLFGALVGQVAEGLRRRGAEVGRDCARLKDENQRLQAERELLVLARQDIQQRLGLFGAESASLDEELQELAETSREFAPAQLLGTLERITRVRSAALYLVSVDVPSSTLDRVACIGESNKFPDKVDPTEHQIVREALEESAFLIQKSLLESTPSRTPGFLGAYAITGVDDAPTYLLLVQDMPFNEIKPNTFDVMKTICDWMRFAFRRSVDHEARHRSVSQDEFYEAIEAAVATHTEQAIPSTLVRMPFDFPEEIDPTEAFRNLLESLPRATVLSNSNEGGQRALLFLLPANSNPQSRDSLREVFLEFRTRLGLGREGVPRFVMTSPRDTPQQLWGTLVAHDRDVASR